MDALTVSPLSSDDFTTQVPVNLVRNAHPKRPHSRPYRAMSSSPIANSSLVTSSSLEEKMKESGMKPDFQTATFTFKKPTHI